MRTFKNILFSIGGAFLLSQFQNLLGSGYIVEFLKNNLVALLIALLAINAASLGIVLSKIRELIDSCKGFSDFSKTQREMLFSVKEQIILIFLSLILLMINDSAWLVNHPKLTPAVETSIITCFVYGMLILFDTAKSIFVILSFKKNGNK
jgi:hypothetical protein